MKRYCTLIAIMVILGVLVACTGTTTNQQTTSAAIQEQTTTQTQAQTSAPFQAQTTTSAQAQATVTSQAQTTTSAATSGSGEQKSVTLSFWGYDGDPFYSDLLNKYIAMYEKDNPGITVEYLGLPAEEAKAKFDLSIATKTFPDTAFISSAWTAPFALANGLLELDTYFDNWNEKDNAIEQFFNTGISFGKRYAVPCDATVYCVWYRPDWYAEKGLSVPQDFDTFFSNIEALNDPTNGRYGFTLRGGSNGSHQMEGFLIAYGGATSYFDEQGICYARDPLVLEGLKRYVGLYNTATPESDINNGYREMNAIFDGGMASTMCHNISSYPSHEDTLGEGKFAMFVLPTAKNGVRTVAFCGVAATSHLVISGTTPYPDEAWAFVSYLLSDEIHSDWVKSQLVFPVTNSVSTEQWINESQALSEVRTVLDLSDAIFIEAPFYLPDFDDIHANILQPAMQELLLGQMSPEDFIEMYASAMEASLVQYNRLIP